MNKNKKIDLSEDQKKTIDEIVEIIKKDNTKLLKVKTEILISEIMKSIPFEKRQPKNTFIKVFIDIYRSYLKNYGNKFEKRFMKELEIHIDPTTCVMFPNPTNKKLSILTPKWNMLWKLQLVVVDLEMEELRKKEMERMEKELEQETKKLMEDEENGKNEIE